MRPVDVLPAIRSAAAPRELSADERWRARRNRALADAGYRCRACGAKRDLHVQPVTLDHLGAEADDALEVLCGGCLEGRDFAAAQDPDDVHASVALYARIVSDILSERRLTHFSDVVEEAKRRCVAARIPYQTDDLHVAIARLVSRFPADVPAREPARQHDHDKPLTRTEAADILSRLKAAAVIKRMPDAPRMTSRRLVDPRIVAKQIVALMLDQVQRCEEAEAAAAEHERTDTD